MLYTVVPLVIGRACSSTSPRATRTSSSTSSSKPDRTVSVVGKQWSWDFNYLDEDVYETGTHRGSPPTL